MENKPTRHPNRRVIAACVMLALAGGVVGDAAAEGGSVAGGKAGALADKPVDARNGPRESVFDRLSKPRAPKPRARNPAAAAGAKVAPGKVAPKKVGVRAESSKEFFDRLSKPRARNPAAAAGAEVAPGKVAPKKVGARAESRQERDRRMWLSRERPHGAAARAGGPGRSLASPILPRAKPSGAAPGGASLSARDTRETLNLDGNPPSPRSAANLEVPPQGAMPAQPGEAQAPKLVALNGVKAMYLLLSAFAPSVDANSVVGDKLAALNGMMTAADADSNWTRSLSKLLNDLSVGVADVRNASGAEPKPTVLAIERALAADSESLQDNLFAFQHSFPFASLPEPDRLLAVVIRVDDGNGRNGGYHVFIRNDGQLVPVGRVGARSPEEWVVSGGNPDIYVPAAGEPSVDLAGLRVSYALYAPRAAARGAQPFDAQSTQHVGTVGQTGAGQFGAPGTSRDADRRAGAGVAEASSDAQRTQDLVNFFQALGAPDDSAPDGWEDHPEGARFNGPQAVYLLMTAYADSGAFADDGIDEAGNQVIELMRRELARRTPCALSKCLNDAKLEFMAVDADATVEARNAQITHMLRTLETEQDQDRGVLMRIDSVGDVRDLPDIEHLQAVVLRADGLGADQYRYRVFVRRDGQLRLVTKVGGFPQDWQHRDALQLAHAFVGAGYARGEIAYALYALPDASTDARHQGRAASSLPAGADKQRPHIQALYPEYEEAARTLTQASKRLPLDAIPEASDKSSQMEFDEPHRPAK